MSSPNPQSEYGESEKLRYFIGDVRDEERLISAFNEIGTPQPTDHITDTSKMVYPQPKEELRDNIERILVDEEVFEDYSFGAQSAIIDRLLTLLTTQIEKAALAELEMFDDWLKRQDDITIPAMWDYLDYKRKRLASLTQPNSKE